MKHSHANDKNRGANAYTQILNTPTAVHNGRTHTDNTKVGGKERFLDELQPEGEEEPGIGPRPGARPSCNT